MDIALILFLLLAATGLIWGLDRALFARRRGPQGREPVYVEYARAFFPVILIVFLLRSFLVEPFRIPSPSMMPNLFDGDFILVNKYSYGVRLPIVHHKLVDLGAPRRGDVAVFRFPNDPSTNYIKRIIGVPGDRILYKDKRIYVNGQVLEYGDSRPYDGPYRDSLGGPGTRLTENMMGVKYAILVTDRPDHVQREETVPEGHYFVLGDNRDHSNDSRFWGMVPDRHLVGRAFLIWFSLDWSRRDVWFWERIAWSRIGTTIR
jgi:signal peptidase I